AGVDDYVVKPFSSRELLARIRAVMRRSREDDEDGSVALGRLRIDGAAHRVFAGDEPVSIGPTEYRLLHFFMTHADRVYSRSQLLDHVWGGSVYVEERTVDVHIRRLRKTLEPFELDGMVQTVRGAGYRFSAAVQTGGMPPNLKTSWQRTLAILAAVLVLALLAGLVLGPPWPALAIAALALLAAHLLRLRRIMRILDARLRLPPPPAAGGAWAGMERLLHRGRGESRGRERKLVEMMRAYRAVATALPDALVVVDRNTQRVIWCNA